MRKRERERERKIERERERERERKTEREKTTDRQEEETIESCVGAFGSLSVRQLVCKYLGKAQRRLPHD